MRKVLIHGMVPLRSDLRLMQNKASSHKATQTMQEFEGQHFLILVAAMLSGSQVNKARLELDEELYSSYVYRLGRRRIAVMNEAQNEAVNEYDSEELPELLNHTHQSAYLVESALLAPDLQSANDGA